MKEKLEGDAMPSARLSDKEVGELWVWCQDEQPVAGKDKLVDAMRGLIRKLVDERGYLLYANQAERIRHDLTTSEHAWLWAKEQALRDFGIQPEDFKHE